MKKSSVCATYANLRKELKHRIWQHQGWGVAVVPCVVRELRNELTWETLR